MEAKVHVSSGRLKNWMHQFLLGVLSQDKVEALKRELQKKERENKISSDLEMKILAAFTSDGTAPRDYLAKLFKTEEKRKFGN